jgi:5-formyltetrahydrofolate cyclo-ligase
LRLISTAASPKTMLRRDALARRSAIDSATHAAFGRRLAEEGLRLARLWGAPIVSAFHSLHGEPETLGLMTALASQGFATALPAVVAPDAPLTFRLWRPGEPTRAGAMSIREPLAEAEVVNPDLLFVPLACFDRRGYRIGYGAGFYDRSLARLRAMKPVRAIGVAFGSSEVDSVPDESHDQILDGIVTEQETILFTEP